MIKLLLIGFAFGVLAAEICDRAPDSCSFRIAMIGSSEKRLRFMFWSSQGARTNFKLDQARGATSASEFIFANVFIGLLTPNRLALPNEVGSEAESYAGRPQALGQLL